MIPPQDVEAEKAVIGAVMIDPNAISEVAGTLRPDHFYSPDYRRVYGAAVDLWASGQRPDMVTIQAALGDQGVNVLELLSGAMGAVPSAANVKHYAGIVVDRAQRRMAISELYRLSGQAYDTAVPFDKTVGGIEGLIGSLADMVDSAGPVKAGDVLPAVWHMIDGAMAKGPMGIPTGFPDLDHYITGLYPGELVVIAGRPSMGKTTLACNMADEMALRQRRPVLFYSLETSAEQLVMNAIGRRADLSPKLLRDGEVAQSQLSRVSASSADVEESGLLIDDTPGLSLMGFRAKTRRAKLRQKIQAVFVDYLQQMDYEERRELEALGEITRGFKNLARELSIPVVLLSQLSRGPESREGHNPRLSDLRGSGTIEQDADVILLLFRPDYYDREDRPGMAQVLVAKNRNGPTGDFALKFNAQLVRFEEWRGAPPQARGRKKEPW